MSIQFTDPVMQALADRVKQQFGDLPVVVPVHPKHYFEQLVESIVSQQLSTKVADTIFGRVKVLTGRSFLPKKLLELSVEDLRQAGLSYSKVSYVHTIAHAWEERLIDPRKLEGMEDEGVIEALTQIKGIGRWTAEMFLLFTLGRPNVFSVGDYALRKAISATYGTPMESKPAEFLRLAEQWSPHKSHASRVLWKSLHLT